MSNTNEFYTSTNLLELINQSTFNNNETFLVLFFDMLSMISESMISIANIQWSNETATNTANNYKDTGKKIKFIILILTKVLKKV